MPGPNEFCTIVDAEFLPQVVVLARSLADVCSDFRLRVYCLDAESLEVLRRLRLPGSLPIDFAALEAADPDLRAVKPTRTRAEYCWTATPALCRYVLDTEPELGMITYLDADLMFFADPAVILADLNRDSVLLFPQRIGSRVRGWSDASGSTAAERLTATYGSFNAGTISFRNDERGRAALDWWRDRCLEWCFDRKEPGRWSDQRYLDELPSLFPGVRVASHPGAALAPWNTHACELARHDGTLVVDGAGAVFHHYQSLRVRREPVPALPARWLANTYRLQGEQSLIARHDRAYELSRTERRLLWEPYFERLERAVSDIGGLMPRYAAGLPRVRWRDVVADASHAGFLAVYRLAEQILPSWLRATLSRTRVSLEREWAKRRASPSGSR